MILKQAQKIEVGLHEGRPGFTVEYTDGERAHFVFHRSIARSLGEALIKVANDLDYLDRQMSTTAPASGVHVSDFSQVKLTPPKNLGISTSEGIDTND